MKFKGLIATALSGSLAGIVASHNRGGPYFRSRALPTNPNSTNQQDVRDAMGTLASTWASLSQSQRDGWKSYADQTPVEVDGETRFFTGFNMFIRGNTPRLYFNVDAVLDPPVDAGLPTYTTPTIGIDATTKNLVVLFEDTDSWVNTDGAFMYVTASNGLNQTINYFKSGFKKAGEILGDDLTAPTSPQSLGSDDTWTANRKVFTRVNICDEQGRIGQAVIASGIAV